MISRVVAVAALSISSLVFAADWPQFRGPQANGISPETGINKEWAAKAPKELWRVPLTDKGYSGPAVGAGKLYIVDHDGAEDIVRCLNLQTGEELWRFAYADATKANYGFARATPCIDDGKVYTVSMQGKVHCLDAAKGTLIWKRDYAEFKGKAPGWGFSASPIIDGDRLLLLPGGAGALLAVVNKKTGATMWTTGDDKVGYASPVIATINGKKQYVVFSGSGLNSFDAAKGQPLWNFPWKTSYDVNAAAPVVMENAVFISSGYGTGCAMIDMGASGPVQRWRNKGMQQHFSSAIAWEGMLYGTTDPGELVCIDPATGADKWRAKGFEKGGCIAVDNVILALGGKTGDLVMASLSPESYKELGRIKPLGGQSWTAPIFADGKIVVRNTTSLACFEAK